MERKNIEVSEKVPPPDVIDIRQRS